MNNTLDTYINELLATKSVKNCYCGIWVTYFNGGYKTLSAAKAQATIAAKSYAAKELAHFRGAEFEGGYGIEYMLEVCNACQSVKFLVGELKSCDYATQRYSAELAQAERRSVKRALVDKIELELREFLKVYYMLKNY
jgi:hypothetical protein